MDPDDLATIDRIAAAVEAADGATPLDEATRLVLAHHPERVRAVVRGGGFALLVDGDLSLAVAPDVRRRGVGRDLLAAALDGASGEVRAWSHGDHPGAVALAAGAGFERFRELWVMRRSLDDLPALAGDGLPLRGFAPGDEEEVVRVNAAAFAHHPEQGSMDLANLRERMDQEWFDPAGLIEAWEGARLLGFHWTKRHDADHGEVYVVGIAPEAQGRGLGRRLTLAGLHHLHDGGAREVLLYVESDNRAAVATYTGLGFTHDPADTHVMYRREI